MKRYFVAFAFLLNLVSAQAGDLAEFRPLGFSESGQYYAYAQTGIYDGSGFPYAQLSVIDVVKNELVATGSVELTEETDGNMGTAEQALQKVIAACKLERFSIKPHQTNGQDLLIHLPTDYSQFTNNIFAFYARPEGGASGVATRYEVRVETTETKPATADIPAEFGPARLLKLSIAGLEEASGTVSILQEEKSLPVSRPCPLSYTVRRVTSYGEGLVVILSYTTPGFEGPDVRYFAVSGKFANAEG